MWGACEVLIERSIALAGERNQIKQILNPCDGTIPDVQFLTAHPQERERSLLARLVIVG